MFRSRVIFIVFVAVLALSALAPTWASAATAGWMVKGTLLASGSTANFATTAKVDKEAILKSEAAGIELLCNGENLTSGAPKIEGGNMASAAFLEYSGCKTLTPNCTLGSTAIKTVPLLAEATLEGALAVTIKLKPQTKTVLATFKFEGANCASSGAEAATGALTFLAPTGQDENTLQLLNAVTIESTAELKVGGNGASLTGSALAKLASGEPWSFL